MSELITGLGGVDGVVVGAKMISPVRERGN